MKSFALPLRSQPFSPRFLWVSVTLLAMVSFVGCQPSATKPTDMGTQGDAHAHNHDHEAHGPNGGHMVHLEPSGSHAEWTHDDDAGKLAIHLEEIEELGKKIDSVKVELEVKGEPKKTYDFVSAGKGVFELISPELLTAIEVGSGDKEKVMAKLIVSIDGKDETTALEHHEHHH
jgi:hypothetical protein